MKELKLIFYMEAPYTMNTKKISEGTTLIHNLTKFLCLSITMNLIKLTQMTQRDLFLALLTSFNNFFAVFKINF